MTKPFCCIERLEEAGNAHLAYTASMSMKNPLHQSKPPKTAKQSRRNNAPFVRTESDLLHPDAHLAATGDPSGMIELELLDDLTTVSPPAGKSRPLAYSDLDVAQWRELTDIETDSLWIIPSRERRNGHQNDYHGNCIPQILTQLITRFTKTGDTVLDMFLGSGTTAIEAANLNRHTIGVELQARMITLVQQKLAEQNKTNEAVLIQGDSSHPHIVSAIQNALQAQGKEQAQFLFLHPPYDDIIRFSEESSDLSNLSSTDAFLEQFEQVCRNGFDVLEPGRFAALVIGDKYTGGEWLPLGFWCMERMNRAGFKTKSIIVKNIEGNAKGKGQMNNLWRYRALVGGFYIFKHEYVFLFYKPPVKSARRSKKRS